MPLDPFSRLRRLFIYSLFIDRHSHLNIFASMWIDPRAWHRMYLQQIGDGKRDFSLETLNGYKEMFGVDPSVTAMAWEYLTERTEIDKKVLPKHLHDTLATMRVYATEGNMTKLTREGAKKPVTAKTHRKWVWKVAPALASLEGILV